jgi:hypothetical protein
LLSGFLDWRKGPLEDMSVKPTRNDLENDESNSSELGPNSAGHSGDTQGLSTDEDGDSESVTELLEEGQYFEASVLSGIENAPPADVAEVTTKQVPEDDVPEEYLNQD